MMSDVATAVDVAVAVAATRYYAFCCYFCPDKDTLFYFITTARTS